MRGIRYLAAMIAAAAAALSGCTAEIFDTSDAAVGDDASDATVGDDASDAAEATVGDDAAVCDPLVGTSSHATQQRARTIEIVDHVPGAQVVKANILIAAPAGTSASQALEAVKQRLLSMGVEVTWAAMSLVGIEVQAALLRAICCWAEVDYVEVPVPYWQVVQPPWDQNEVGTAACPVVNGACPPYCDPVHCAHIDTTNACVMSDPKPTACAMDWQGSNGIVKCRVRISDGAVYSCGSIGPLAPEYAGWRDCTAAERDVADAIEDGC
jgi:hypothetical protein